MRTIDVNGAVSTQPHYGSMVHQDEVRTRAEERADLRAIRNILVTNIVTWKLEAGMNPRPRGIKNIVQGRVCSSQLVLPSGLWLRVRYWDRVALEVVHCAC
jgi:hypothetical protein